MQAASLPHALMQSAATWASSSVATSVLSTSKPNALLGSDSHLLKGEALCAQACRLPSWSLHRLHRLPRRGPSTRVAAMGAGGGNSDASPSQDIQVINLQPRSSSAPVVKGDEVPGIADDEVGVLSRLIDDQLLQILQNKESPVRQTVLMTDGTGGRPYRLLWPSPSVIFDVSPEHALTETAKRQNEMGLKLPRSCLLQHVSVDIMHEDWGDAFVDDLVSKGYRGDVPSVWAIEMPRAKLSEASLQEVFTVASSLLMKGSKFLGIIFSPWVGKSELECRALLRKLCAGNGFTVKILSREELVSSNHSGMSLASFPNLAFAFVSEQQRLSDAQVEYAQMQMQMAEEVDEDGFEDSW